MMTAVVAFNEAVLFSPDISKSTNTLLQQAVVASRTDKETAEGLFQLAHLSDPTCLYTYFALYKFYFYQAKLSEAETYVLSGLMEAARQGGFPADYRDLLEGRLHWNMYASEAGMFYLYTLKAWSFIKLRQNYLVEAGDILAAIRTLDPEDRSGASVVMSLAAAMDEESA